MTRSGISGGKLTSALIGYSGFVGQNLLLARQFDDLYNSKNLDSIAGKRYDFVVSAAGRADSFRINRNGEADLAELEGLANKLASAETDKLVLISTVCVYEAGSTPDESTPIRTENLTPYGRNRRRLEQILTDRFDTLIVRLPQLFGVGVKKGIVFDLLNRYRLEHIRPNGVFQYYDLSRLWNDIEVALTAGVRSLNLATPPLVNERVARDVFGIDLSGQVTPEPEAPFAAMYTRDMRTRHAPLFGREGPYLMSAEEELAAMQRFLQRTSCSRDQKLKHHAPGA